MSDLPNIKKRKVLRDSKFKNQKGQALLIILLLMSVVLTIVLSVASRSVTEVTISKYEEDSARALSAAEAGVEETLITGGTTGGTLDNSATYTTDVVLLTSSGGEFVYPDRIKSGEAVTFWMVSHDTNGDITCDGQPCFQGDDLEICWGEQGTSSAMEITFFYDPDTVNKNWEPHTKDFSGINIKRFAYDDPASAAANNFADAQVGSANCAIAGNGFAFSTPILDLSNTFLPECNPSTTAGCLLMVRAWIFYNGDNEQPIGIATPGFTSGLPSQGAVIDSVGTFADSTRRIKVFRSHPSPPDVFDSAVFSYGSISK